MEVVIVTFSASLICTMLIVLSNTLHGRFTNDHDLDSIQKFHHNPVPRVGGLALFIALGIVYYFSARFKNKTGDVSFWLLFSSIPVFLVGMLEDITKKMSAKFRLYISFLSAGMVYFFLNIHFTRIDWPLIDQSFLSIPAISFCMTLLVIGGTVHALNLIDGFNGLMLGVSLMAFAVIAVVSSIVGDDLVLFLSSACFAAIMGLFVVNFPLGKIFAGDSGAYFIGFLLGVVALMLVQRNHEVSAWFPCLLLIYPLFETVFSIYRKLFIRGMTAMQPDGVHLHMLVYKRISRHRFSKQYMRNAMTSPYLWLLAMIGIVPSALFWNNNILILGSCFLFALSYLRIYWYLVRFKDRLGILRNVKYLHSVMTKESA